jgi:Transglutaminase-like superfamily
MWKPFQRYRVLDPETRELFHRALALLPMIAFSLRLRGFKKTREALQRKPSPDSPQKTAKEKAAEKVQKTCRMVKAAAHYGIVRPSCLVESLALWHLLQRQNIPARLRIGVHKLPNKFEAHAWVEYESSALNQAEGEHQHYAAFDRGFSDLPGEES